MGKRCEYNSCLSTQTGLYEVQLNSTATKHRLDLCVFCADKIVKSGGVVVRVEEMPARRRIPVVYSGGARQSSWEWTNQDKD